MINWSPTSPLITVQAIFSMQDANNSRFFVVEEVEVTRVDRGESVRWLPCGSTLILPSSSCATISGNPVISPILGTTMTFRGPELGI